MGHHLQNSPTQLSLGQPKFANYLPDELLLEILTYIPPGPETQETLATWCLVSRQWYDVAIQRLYEAPFLAGKAYDLFTRTICPSINVHIKKSELAGLGTYNMQPLSLTFVLYSRVPSQSFGSLTYRAPR